MCTQTHQPTNQPTVALKTNTLINIPFLHSSCWGWQADLCWWEEPPGINSSLENTFLPWEVLAEAGVESGARRGLSRCWEAPVISCIGTCWQMRLWSSLSHDPSWDVSQHVCGSTPISILLAIPTLSGTHPCKWLLLRRLLLSTV